MQTLKKKQQPGLSNARMNACGKNRNQSMPSLNKKIDQEARLFNLYSAVNAARQADAEGGISCSDDDALRCVLVNS